jgi:hypothetical protein
VRSKAVQTSEISQLVFHLFLESAGDEMRLADVWTVVCQRGVFAQGLDQRWATWLAQVKAAVKSCQNSKVVAKTAITGGRVALGQFCPRRHTLCKLR